MQTKILVIGASGQIGSELVIELRNRFGRENVIAADVKEPSNVELQNGLFEFLDILDKQQLNEVVEKHDIKVVYQLAALLSATSEKNPEFAWKLNMEGLLNVLELAKIKIIDKIFWPSSIAVFGPNSPKEKTPQYCTMDPNTVYGISKLAGERWCEYYHAKHGVDVRSIRYPGLISYKSPPGGGTTDYAVDIFFKAKREQSYTCFLSENTALPMMFMEDAINATINIMEASPESIKIRSSYNVSGVSFTPKELYQEIKKSIPEFQIQYEPDFRQKIADSWPSSIDDRQAREHWEWENSFSIPEICNEMLKNIK